jgi:hypothetical protein
VIRAQYTTTIAEKLQGCCAARMTYGVPAHPSLLAFGGAAFDRRQPYDADRHRGGHPLTVTGEEPPTPQKQMNRLQTTDGPEEGSQG